MEDVMSIVRKGFRCQSNGLHASDRLQKSSVEFTRATDAWHKLRRSSHASGRP